MSRNTVEWAPYNGEGYLQWNIPSQCWSGEEYGEDTIKITLSLSDGEWNGVTEMDQCVKRDLDDDDINQIREEAGLNQWLQENRPELLKPSAPTP
jgi:hypothetical protein